MLKFLLNIYEFLYVLSFGSVIIAKWLLNENFNKFNNDYAPQKSGQHQSVFIHANQKNMLSDAQSPALDGNLDINGRKSSFMARETRQSATSTKFSTPNL
ncbi:unnamed protein product [Caenorhabditis angaria]|uniref:Uncharacterized protein n=1 Tax=Caenorhabditis angaria TaxID=860376 RepID=A0A9P1IXA4_9PELO|nr:unnamed protein product [Caenorhabditis angaria]